jgi:hypothetical protein
MTIPSREIMAAKTRELIERHDEWDSLHAFATLHWDDGQLRFGTVAMIDPGISPDQYPELMRKIAAGQFGKHPDDPPYAYLLQIEAFGCVDPGPDASEEERRQFDVDRLGRTFHQRADAREIATAYCADIHGRVWSATKARGEEDRIEEHFYGPGKSLGGQFIRALLAVAMTTGMAAHGLRPSRQGETWN